MFESALSIKDTRIDEQEIIQALIECITAPAPEEILGHDTATEEVRMFRVYHGEYPYEVWIRHPRYLEGTPFCVDSFPTREMAEEGFKEWVVKMSAAELPEMVPFDDNFPLARIAKKYLPEQYSFIRLDQRKDEPTHQQRLH